MATEHSIVREVTDAEVRSYRENGWVKLEEFVDRAVANEMFEQAKELAGKALLPHFVARDDRREPFRSVVFSAAIGKATQRLIRRDTPIKYFEDLVACKRPDTEEIPTVWHQDLPKLPFDRVGSLLYWIALHDLSADQGVTRLISGSHRAGPLGRMLSIQSDALAAYPEILDEYEMSEPMPAAAGDAIVYDSLTLHSPLTNSTDSERWIYAATYFPADTLYNGAQNYNTDGLDLEVDKPLEHERFPTIYPPTV
jgi:ectoine hydroxylase-related dioxygenase (phytanoyl-CoA dioxygenase family)